MRTRDKHEAGLRRGRRLWDLLSHVPERLVDGPAEPVRQLVREHLRAPRGGTVLDVGCGSGTFFTTLREAVGPEGRVVGVDYSPKMVRRAQQRIERHEWSNVTVERADASRAPLGDEDYDAAIVISSVSAMPDMRAAIENIYAALRPGGRLFIFDMRLQPAGRAPIRLVIRSLRLVYRLMAGFTGEDVLAELRRSFDTIEILPASSPAIAIAVAAKAATSSSGPSSTRANTTGTPT